MKLMIPVSLAAVLLVAGHADAATHAPRTASTASCGKQGDAQHCQSHAKRTSNHRQKTSGARHTTARNKSHGQHQVHAKAATTGTTASPTEQ